MYDNRHDANLGAYLRRSSGLGDISADAWVQQSGYDAAYFEGLKPGAWTGPGRSDILSSGAGNYNPTLSNDPTMIGMVNQQIANGTNPFTGQPSQLNIAVLNKGYRWQGAGDIVNPYTQQVMGNAFDLGKTGVANLPNAFNMQAAWDNLGELAASRGYIIGADGSLQDMGSRNIIAQRFPSYNEIAAGGNTVYQQALQIVGNVPVAAVITAPPAPVNTTIPEPPKTIVAPPVTPDTPPMPSGWHAGELQGKTGFWAPDGLFYAGVSPWTGYVPGTGVSIRTVSQQVPPSTGTESSVADEMTTYSDSKPLLSPLPEEVLLDANGQPAPAMAGMPVLLGLGLVGALLFAGKRRT